jgi:hypothetical protein
MSMQSNLSLAGDAGASPARALAWLWIPAFAGMTKRGGEEREAEHEKGRARHPAFFRFYG